MNTTTQNKPSRTARRASRIGGFSVLICAVVLCILVVLNLVVLSLPANVTQFDISGLGITEISDKSKKFVSDVTEDVTIYWLCEGGVIDETLDLVLASYDDLSDHVKVEKIDPLTDPTFTLQYTTSELTNYSLIVESELRCTIVDSTEFYYYTNDFVDQQLSGGRTYKLTEDEYYTLYESYGSYMDAAATYAFFQGEALISSAIDYVTLPVIPHTYLLTGHGEQKMSDILTEAMGIYQVAPEELNLQKASQVPTDASCIIIFAPASDLSPNEATLLQEYVKAGGSIMLVTSPACASFTNLASVTSLFGMSAAEGIVVDTTKDYYYKETHNLVPMVNTSIDPLYTIYGSGYYAYMPMSHGISIQETLPTGVAAQVLFATSDKAYRISTDGQKTQLCDPATVYLGTYGTIEGVASDGTATQGKLTWYASAQAFTDDETSQFSGSNYFYLSLMTRYMSNLYSSPFGDIQGVNLTIATLNNMTAPTALALGIVMIVVIPVAFFVTGLVIWLKRRSR